MWMHYFKAGENMIPQPFRFLAVISTLLFAATLSAQTTTTSSTAPTTHPAWLSLRELVYQEDSVEAGEKHVLSFEPNACWFLSYTHPVSKQQFDRYVDEFRRKHGGVMEFQTRSDWRLPDPLPYPTTLSDVPTEDRGVRLSLNVFPGPDAATLALDMILSSEKRPVWREVEHRYTVIVPMLFTFLVDGKPLTLPGHGFAKDGGSQSSVQLISAGRGQRRWSLRVSTESIKKLLPDDRPHLISIAAAFSERQRVGLAAIELEDLGGFFTPPKGHEGPQLLVRSNLALIQWTGKEWKAPNAPPSATTGR